MPALPNVTFAVQSGGHPPTYAGPGIFALKVPDSSEAVAANTVENINFHNTVNIPTGYAGLIFSTGAEPAANTTVLAEVSVGDGTANTIGMRAQNMSLSNVAGSAMTANTDIAHFVLVKTQEATFTSTGP